MTVIEKENATKTLASYADDVETGPVVVTEKGRPVAVLVSIENADLETVSLSSNPQFLRIIERSRRRARTEDTLSSAEMRRRFASVAPKKTRSASKTARHG